MISDENRAFFLNELDGFQVNSGVAVIATTNHTEKLDPAILDRPSRFDRKYQFNLPGENGREAYLKAWNEGLQLEMHLSEAVVTEVVSSTDGFSFAYMKELFLSSTVEWMAAQREGTMDEIVKKQVGALRAQMTAVSTESTPTARRFKLFKRA